MKICLSLLLLQAACLPHEGTSFIAALVTQRPRSKLWSSLQYIDDTNSSNILSSSEFVLVDACATWCGPCKLIEPLLQEASEQYPTIEVVKYDVDSSETIDFKMNLILQNSHPKALPMLILFQAGKVVSTHVGVITKEQLQKFLTPFVPVAAAADKEKGFVHLSLSSSGGDDYMLSSFGG